MRILALALTGTLAWGQPVEGSHNEFLKLPGLLLDDAKAVARAPGQWTAAQWQSAGWAAAAVLGIHHQQGPHPQMGFRVHDRIARRRRGL